MPASAVHRKLGIVDTYDDVIDRDEEDSDSKLKRTIAPDGGAMLEMGGVAAIREIYRITWIIP